MIQPDRRYNGNWASNSPVATPIILCYDPAIRPLLVPESAKPAPPASGKQRGTGLISRRRDKDILANRIKPVKGFCVLHLAKMPGTCDERSQQIHISSVFVAWAAPRGACYVSAANPTTPFAGYGRPKYTQLPNIFIDEQMQDLTESEIKCMLYIFRRTFGFHEDGAVIQLSHFVKGWITFDGRRLDRGAGVAMRSLSPALKDLELKGFIFRHQQQNTQKGSIPTYYELNIDGVPHCTEDCRADCGARALATGTPYAKLADPPYAKLADPPPGNACIPPVGKTCPPLSTIERKNLKRKNPPPTPFAHIPAAKSEPMVEVVEDSDQVKTDTDLLVAFGLDEETARDCALLAERNKRLGGYVSEQIEYVQSSPSVKDPVAVLIANIRKNRRHKPPAQAATSASGQAATPTLYLVAESRDGTPPDPTDPIAIAQEAAESERRRELDQLWSTALISLRLVCSDDDYKKALRYAQLIALDPTTGRAVLRLPNEGQCQHVRRLAGVIGASLSQVCGAAITIQAISAEEANPRPGTQLRLISDSTESEPPPAEPVSTPTERSHA